MGKVNSLFQDAQEAREDAQADAQMVYAIADVPHGDFDNEDAQGLENDWFTSGETSWEEYYYGEKLK